ncbi:hypothetical protein FACS189426_15180 [Bacteroidia bacterium]|nr:hypothetical protein FACS189426_15180 [Bacteroidia bacterium]GHV70851.1 hypothetical protein FACS189420_3640 [Bacteroidia bacterium]
MKKEKFHIEYVFDKASRINLWDYISTSAGLSEWFADSVFINGKIYTFTWGKHSNDAELIGTNPGNYIRFRWLDDENPVSFFELRLHKIELTGGTMLEITDYAEIHETKEAINLWETQIKNLKRNLGL